MLKYFFPHLGLEESKTTLTCEMENFGWEVVDEWVKSEHWICLEQREDAMNRHYRRRQAWPPAQQKIPEMHCCIAYCDGVLLIEAWVKMGDMGYRVKPPDKLDLHSLISSPLWPEWDPDARVFTRRSLNKLLKRLGIPIIKRPKRKGCSIW